MERRKPAPGRALALHAQYGALVAALLTGPAAASGCRLALALGLDVSRSVSPADYAVERGGVVAALGDRRVRQAFLSGSGPVALAVYEWSGSGQQALVLDWRLIASDDDLDAAAAVVARHRRAASAMTAMGAAMAYADGLFARAPDCAARTLDLSGDGRSNVGPGPADIHAAGALADVTVNGLAIQGEETDIVPWYRANVARGPGSFVEVAASQDDFPRAFRRKLERELAETVLGSAAAAPGRTE